MATKKISETRTEVRGMDDAKLGAELKSTRSQLIDLRNKSVTEKIDDVTQFRKTRKQIARILTERNRRTAAKAAPKASAKASAKASKGK